MSYIDFCDFFSGFSTGFMLLGFNLQNTKIWYLHNMYLLHWCISFLYHMYHTKTLYLMDTLSIQLLVCERIHYGLGPCLGNISRIFFLLNPIVNKYLKLKPHNYTVFFIAICTILYLFNTDYKLNYFIPMFSSGVFFYLSSLYRQTNYNLSTLFCIIYHFFQGVVSYIEGPYSLHQVDGITSILRYFTYFSLVFWTAQKQNLINFRLQSVISLCAATTLAPIGLYDCYKFVTDYDNYISTYNINYYYREQTIYVYLAYAIADTVFGCTYYPEFFPLLEGWLHHIFSGGYAYYCLKSKSPTSCCLAMIVELPSIILFSSRVFNTSPIVSFMRKKIFPCAFIIFRVLALGYIVINLYCQNLLKLPVLLFYFTFAILNLHWWSIIMKIKLFSKQL